MGDYLTYNPYLKKGKAAYFSSSPPCTIFRCVQELNDHTITYIYKRLTNVLNYPTQSREEKEKLVTLVTVGEELSKRKNVLT